MKFYETHFEEYINNNETLHPKLLKLYNTFPKYLYDLNNLIFFGPNGTGKYTQMLQAIKKYSPSELKYEKKISITHNDLPFFFKISDIHYEVDLSLLGCNSKLLWHEIYQQIIDIISAKTEKYGIIVCKNFHEIHNELLDIFYSYMQKNAGSPVQLIFILITEELSFIPNNIINCCKVINVSRPSKSNYAKYIKNNTIIKNIKLENITNIKLLHLNNEELLLPYKVICDKIIHNIININELQYLQFREILYDIFIYNLNMNDCIWYILSTLVNKHLFQKEQFAKILKKTFCFFQYYNNNYRPIYHLEYYLLYLAQTIHNFNK